LEKVWPGDGLGHRAGGWNEVEEKSWGSSCGGILGSCHLTGNLFPVKNQNRRLYANFTKPTSCDSDPFFLPGLWLFLIVCFE